MHWLPRVILWLALGYLVSKVAWVALYSPFDIVPGLLNILCGFLLGAVILGCLFKVFRSWSLPWVYPILIAGATLGIDWVVSFGFVTESFKAPRLLTSFCQSGTIWLVLYNDGAAVYKEDGLIGTHYPGTYSQKGDTVLLDFGRNLPLTKLGRKYLLHDKRLTEASGSGSSYHCDEFFITDN